MKPYYEQDGIAIYHGDAREIVPSLPRPALVLADPPYGVSQNRGDLKARGTVRGDDEPFDPGYLVAMDVPTVLFGANAYADRLPASRGWLVWDKTHGEKCEHSQAELAWTNFVGGIRMHREAYHGFMRKKDGWVHPNQKPVRLFQWILGLPWTPKDGMVMDPYMGSGTAVIACKWAGRKAIGIEIEERYCDLAVRRLAQGVLEFPEVRE